MRKRHDQWETIKCAVANGESGGGAGTDPDSYVTGSQQAPRLLPRGDPWADGAIGKPGQLRSRALTALERPERMPDTAREVATRAIEEDDDRTTSLAQCTLLASDPKSYRALNGSTIRWPARAEAGRDRERCRARPASPASSECRSGCSTTVVLRRRK